MSKQGIAFVATGSELVCGGVINTSSPWMADRLFNYGFETTEHRVVSDDQSVISDAIHQAIERYQIVLISGGLGPTSDDRTRFALADVLGVTLQFFDAVWQNIVERFRLLNLPIPENNRLQALFPPDAVVLPNKWGTAVGCYVQAKGSHVFMLPGPPNECRPMFEASVLPLICKLLPPKWPARQHWFLLGTSESSIAEKCDPLIDSHAVELGYRVDYPYLELKLFATDPVSLDRLVKQINPLVASVCVGSAPASEQLRQRLQASQLKWSLRDFATGQRLLSRLLQPDTAHCFVADAQWVITVTGLDDFWRGESTGAYQLHLVVTDTGKEVMHVAFEIPHRGLRSLDLAAEWVCWQLLQVM